MENKFSALPVIVTLSDSMEKSYANVKKATTLLKNSIGIVYSVYAMGFWSSVLLPRAFCQLA